MFREALDVRILMIDIVRWSWVSQFAIDDRNWSVPDGLEQVNAKRSYSDSVHQMNDRRDRTWLRIAIS
jgi:hypothetical protein